MGHVTTTYHGLRARCFWDAEDLGRDIAKGIAELEMNWPVLRDEALRCVAGDFRLNSIYDEHEGVGDWRIPPVNGEWSYLHLYDSKETTGFGVCRYDYNCNLLPNITSAAESFPRSMLGLVGLSRLTPGSHIPPHRGPFGGRLTLQFPLYGSEGVEIRVGDQRRPMCDGQVMIFDDTYQHEVWHRGPDVRVNLMMDIYHPDLTDGECKIWKTLLDLMHT